MNTYCTFVLLSIMILLVGCVPSMAPTELKFNDSNVATPTNGANSAANRAKSIAAFKATVYPIVRGNTCLNCHDSGSRGQSPIFADADAEKAYDAMTLSRKVDLSKPELSRIVLKVKDESHNCWSGDCAADSQELLDAVKQWVAMAPVNGSEGGISTDTLKLPAESTAQMAQTEYGTLLLQAEQDLYRSEVVSGRYSDQQDSSALDGKYLNLTPIEGNPITNAPRTLTIDAGKYNSCKEFEEADLAQATRALRFSQAKVHIPSGDVNPQGKIVNDGYRPFTSGLAFYIIRPDKRLEYAKMLYNSNFVGVLGVVLTNGAPASVANKAVGQKLPDEFQGTIITTSSPVRFLPHFTDHSTVFNSDLSYKTSGSYVKDDGSQENLYYLFKEGAYSPAEDILQKNLMEASALKKEVLYKKYKETITDMYYSSGTTRRDTPKIPYNNFVNADVVTFFSPEVSVELTCPTGTCASTNLLKYTVNQAGAPLTQGNALDCYTLNAGQTQIVAAAAGNCTGANPKFFHYIDLFARPYVELPFITGAQTVNFFNSTSPNAFVNVESFNEITAKKLVYHQNQDTQELDPDVFFSGGANLVTEEDNLRNFSATLHTTLKTTRCIDCHGNAAMANIPQFASTNVASSLAALKNGLLIDFANPAASFRPNGMIHNCNGNSSDPRYSCATAAEDALRQKLISGINSWKTANSASAADSGTKSYRSLTRDERLPGRSKYKFKVTKAGLHNVWMKLKNKAGGVAINFRILNSNGSPVGYSTGDSASVGGDTCYKWRPTSSIDSWEWISPGRETELASIDQRGYLLLDDKKKPLPLQNRRIYFNLAEGTYTLDVIGLTEGLKLDAVGVNRVENLTADSRLEFQPDRRAIDEKNVADYKRRVLRYDLTGKLGLTGNKKAYFEIEVKKQFSNQNYVFRNPRFITSPRDFNLHVKGIKVFINGKWNFPDATYNELDLITGDNQVLTYAPLVALTNGADDDIHFQFEKLSITAEGLTPIYPKGTPTEPITDRRCADLDYFIRNVKPILFNVRVALNVDLKDYYGPFPGSPRRFGAQTQTYRCISCHTETHPYFKMSTFSNNEEFCREALSRVDFQNFYQSLIVRGVNGTGNHPKFVFMEKLVNGSDDNFKVHDQGQDYMLGRARNASGIATNFLPGPMMLWTKEDMGITKANFSELTAQEKSRIVMNGLFRKITPRTISFNVLNYSWYSADIHYPLIYNGAGMPDNFLSSLDVIDPNPAIGKIELDRTKGVRIYDIDTDNANGIPVAIDYGSGMSPPLKGTYKRYITNGQEGFDPSTIDYISTTPGQDTETAMWTNYEAQRDYYREKIVNWIRRENEARLKEQD